MSSGFTPRRTFKLVLLDDMTERQVEAARRGERVEPAGDQPSFEFRYPSCEEADGIEGELAAAVAEANRENRHGPFIRRTRDAMLRLLVGWAHKVDVATGEPIAYDPDRLGAVLGMADVGELHARLLSEATVQGAQLKKSASRSPSSGATSTPTAPPGGAEGASMSRTPPTPPSSPASPATGRPPAAASAGG